MAQQKRAKKGGEVGMNGEFYQGGEFLPNTDLRSRHKEKGSKGTGKQEIEPYVWAVAPEGKKSIYRYIAGIFGRVNNGTMIINCSDTVLAYYQTNRFAVSILADKYNRGERWF